MIIAMNLQLLVQQLEEDSITQASSFLKKYMEAMMCPDKEKWIKSVNKERKWMVQDGVFQVVNAKESIPWEQKAITSTWTTKKKSDGAYPACLVARGFQQQ